ncbi:MAG: hypothetical protein U1F57_01040 [bacterium]
MRKKIFFVFCLFLVGFSASGARAAQEISGVYDNLIVGVDPQTQTVTGHYENATGWDEKSNAPRFSCIFYLSGKKEGDHYRVKTWFPGYKKEEVARFGDLIEGTLQFGEQDKKTTVTLKLQGEHGGCWNVDPQLKEKEGETFFPVVTGTWKEIRIVSAPKAYFYEKPDLATKQRPYLVKGNAFRVYEKKPGWVLGDYQNTEAEKGKSPITKGWIQESDLYSPTPP